MTAIAGKRIWLTGASSGIGLSLAEQLAAAGADLILTARREPLLRELQQRLPHSERHQVLALDLSNPEQAVASAQAAQLGQIDILINNAGVSQRSWVVDTELAVYRQLMEVDYLAVVALTKWVLPEMLARGNGHIVSVSSVAGKVGTKLRSGYAGAKFAVLGFMDCLRAEVSAQGIVCSSVLPGFINTQVAHNALTGDGSQRARADTDNASGMTAEACAQQIIAAIKHNRDEVVIAEGMSKMAPLLQRFMPGVLRRMMAKRAVD